MAPSDLPPANEPTSSARPEPSARFRPRRAVILAGGKGLRAQPNSSIVNKCLFTIHGAPLIARQIAIIRDQLGITDIIIIVGHLKDQIREALGDGEKLGVSLQYPEVEQIEEGPAKGLLKARALLSEPFFLFLGDEFHLASSHRRLLDHLDRNPDVLFTYTPVTNPRQIHGSFSIEVAEDGRVTAIREKPEKLPNHLCGCGTLYLTPKAIDAIEAAAPSPRTGRVELYEVAASLIPEGRVYGVDLEDPGYWNINTLEDLERARFSFRSRHLDSFKVSVVIPAWNEADSIACTVRDFVSRPEVAEVLVVDNHSEDGTEELARRAGARVVPGHYAGYGHAIKAGLDAARGDILVVAEADYTFRAADLPKILHYLTDAEAVIGTRTCRPMIAAGAEMKPMHRLANIAMAKYMELLWWNLDMRFTDVGCSYRALWKTAWNDIRDSCNGRGPEFAPEMMIEIARMRKKCIEIPIGYHPRYGGASKHGLNLAGLAKTAWRMGKLITGRRFAR